MINQRQDRAWSSTDNSWTLYKSSFLRPQTNLPPTILGNNISVPLSNFIQQFLFLAPPRCLNKDFEGVPDYLTHQYIKTYENGTEAPFPYNITVNGEHSYINKGCRLGFSLFIYNKKIVYYGYVLSRKSICYMKVTV